MQELNYEAVVIGAGIAGLATALRLSELKVRTVVLEKGTDDRYPCNTRIAGGAFHVAHRDVDDPPEVILEAINQRTRGTANPELVQALAGDISGATAWLKAKGVRFIKVGHEIFRKHSLAPPINLNQDKYWEGRGGDILIRTLTSELARHGGQVLLDTRANELVMDAGRCVGVDALHQGAPLRIHARTVVVCDGGFQANPELVARYITGNPDKIRQRNSGSGTGDGLQMAMRAGAQVVGMNRFYGHILAREAMNNDALSPFPIADFLCSAGVVVDASCRRIADEGRGGVYLVNAIAAQDDPLGTVAIFNEAVWTGPGREFISPANPQLSQKGAAVYTAPTVSGLAEQLDLDPRRLEQTLSDYNDAVEQEKTESLAPPRTSDRLKPYSLRQGPYFAVRLCAGMTYTMGGLAIDGRSRVIGPDDRPIPGLYAAGCAAGGLEGGEHVAYLGGLTRSTVTALRAADHIAARQRNPDVQPQ